MNSLIKFFVALKLDLDKFLTEYPLGKPSKADPVLKVVEDALESTEQNTSKTPKESNEETNTVSSESEEEAKPQEKFTTWDTIESSLDKDLPQYKVYVLSYLKWVNQELKPNVIDFNTVPPCGRYLQAIKREYPFSDIIYKPRADSGFHAKPYDSAPQSSQDLERKAIADVREAVSKLKNSKTLKSIKLKPQNSFLRRLQHKKVYQTKGFFFKVHRRKAK